MSISHRPLPAFASPTASRRIPLLPALHSFPPLLPRIDALDKARFFALPFPPRFARLVPASDTSHHLHSSPAPAATAFNCPPAASAIALLLLAPTLVLCRVESSRAASPKPCVRAPSVSLSPSLSRYTCRSRRVESSASCLFKTLRRQSCTAFPRNHCAFQRAYPRSPAPNPPPSLTAAPPPDCSYAL